MYHKQLYLFQHKQPKKATIRCYTTHDFEQLIALQQAAFPPPFPSELWWTKEQLTSHLVHFPDGMLCVEIDGMLCVEIDGTIVGSITSLIVHYEPGDAAHTWAHITDNGSIRTHNPAGNTLYIVDICVHPAFRKMNIGKWLMHAMYELVIAKQLTRLLGGSRMPVYHLHAEHLSPSTYIEHVKTGKIIDPVVTFLMRCGRVPVRIMPDYLEDIESHHYGVLMEWHNPFYN